MRYFRIILCLALFLSFIACTKQAPVEKGKQEFIQITEKIIESYIDSNKTEKETITYNYENLTIFFGKKLLLRMVPEV